MAEVLSPSNGRSRLLYVIRGGPQLSKIGWAYEPFKRATTAHWVRQDGRLRPMPMPERPHVVWIKQCKNHTVAHAVEICAKHLLQNFRKRGEWYEIKPARAIKAVEYIMAKTRKPNLTTAFNFIAAHPPWS